MADALAYAVHLSPAAARALAKLVPAARKRVASVIDALAQNPRPPGARKLIGADHLWRVRGGDYRIIYMIEDERMTVLVVKIGHRRDVYRRR